MNRGAFARSMTILEERYPMKDWTRNMAPFEVLISTVLSQSTTVANERRGLEGLREALGRITPQALADASETTIANAIWHAGLARRKAPRIRGIARAILERWDGRIERIFDLPRARARAELMALPGVGPKTADVVLTMAGGHAIFPVDTHIARTAKRWNLTRHSDYESIRNALERRTPPEKRKAWHLAMIGHGRALCTARNPRCEACPIRPDCDWYLRFRARSRRGPIRVRASRNKGLSGLRN